MLILVEFEVFTKMTSLSPRLAIPMLQIVIKHLKLSLFVCFMRGVPFPFLALTLNSIQFKFICIALFTIQSLQSALQEIKFLQYIYTL